MTDANDVAELKPMEETATPAKEKELPQSLAMALRTVGGIGAAWAIYQLIVAASIKQTTTPGVYIQSPVVTLNLLLLVVSAWVFAWAWRAGRF